MLVLKRKENQWIEIIHKNGDILRIRLCNIKAGSAEVVFDDTDRNFKINRPEVSNRQT